MPAGQRCRIKGVVTYDLMLRSCQKAGLTQAQQQSASATTAAGMLAETDGTFEVTGRLVEREHRQRPLTGPLRVVECAHHVTGRQALEQVIGDRAEVRRRIVRVHPLKHLTRAQVKA